MTARLLRRFRRLPVAVKAMLAALVLLAAYLPVVAVMEAREEARIGALKESDPAAYLEAVRAHGGMAPYLEALADVRHFDAWRETAPAFLIGAWVLGDAAAAPAPNNSAPTSSAPNSSAAGPAGGCRSGMIIEDGGIRWFGDRPRKVAAQYRIVEDHVLARVAGGGVIEIDMDRAQQGEEAIDVTMPGAAAARHGVRCR